MWVRQIADKLAGKWFAKASGIFIGGNALTEVAQNLLLSLLVTE
jgi:hypothetical protein